MDHGWQGSVEWHGIWNYWWLFMLFWWFGGMRLVGAASYRLRHGRRHGQREDEALTTLRERYARGEIDRAEYEERRSVLRGKSEPTVAKSPGADRPIWPDLP